MLSTLHFLPYSLLCPHQMPWMTLLVSVMIQLMHVCTTFKKTWILIYKFHIDFTCSIHLGSILNVKSLTSSSASQQTPFEAQYLLRTHGDMVRAYHMGGGWLLSMYLHNCSSNFFDSSPITKLLSYSTLWALVHANSHTSYQDMASFHHTLRVSRWAPSHLMISIVFLQIWILHYAVAFRYLLSPDLSHLDQ